MRKIGVLEIMTATALVLISGLATYLLAQVYPAAFPSWLLWTVLPPFFLILTILELRLFLYFLPIHEGEIPEKSQQEFIYHVYICILLVIVYPVIRSYILPMPLTRPLFRLLGAKMGENTYTGGLIYDPLFVSIGKNTLCGQNSLIVPHVLEGSRLAHYPIAIGDNVTIGAHSIVMAGSRIGNNSIIAMSSVVTKNSRIGDNEIWGGNPAKLIKRKASGETPEAAKIASVN